MTNEIAKTLEIGDGQGPGRRWGRWLAVVLLVAIAAAAAWIFLRGDQKSAATQYKTEQVRRGDLTVIVTATGTLKPTNSVDVGSELSGIVKSVEADYNSRVKVGQVLARLDTSKLEATITQSRAALESARAKVMQAEATVAETRAKLAQLRKVREIERRQALLAVGGGCGGGGVRARPGRRGQLPRRRSPRPGPSSRRTRRTWPRR